MPNFPITRAAARALLAALFVAACVAGTASASSIEEDDEDVSGADRAFAPPAALLDSSRRHAAETGFGWVGGVGAYAANDENVFRSPRGREQAAGAWGHTGYLRADTRWRRANRVLATFTWTDTRFGRFPQVDSSHPSLSVWYRRRLAPDLALELDGDAVHQNDDATTINGFDYTRDYSYWRYGGEAVLEWTPGARHRVRAGAEQVRKDYGEVAAFNSIDWTNWRTSASYRFRLARAQHVGAKFEYGERRYDEEPASIADGTELPGNPAEHHRYTDLVFWYDAPLGRRAALDASLDLGRKTDLFQGYEDYRDRTVRVGLLARPSAGIELRAGLVAGHRDYARLAADAGETLAYDTIEARFGARLRVLGTWWLYADLNRYERDTNRSTGLDYRDYRGVFSRAGVSVFR